MKVVILRENLAFQPLHLAHCWSPASAWLTPCKENEVKIYYSCGYLEATGKHETYCDLPSMWSNSARSVKQHDST